MPFYRILSAMIDVAITLVTAALGLRVILKLFGADETHFVVKALYAVSGPLIAPFQGMFPALTLESGFVLEFATLFALVMYAIVAHILLTLVRTVAYAVFRRRVMLQPRMQTV